jgi:AraC family transcriptional regulator of adaptative response/methylated-DNA-[protein]-cysteine methyltransferase
MDVKEDPECLLRKIFPEAVFLQGLGKNGEAVKTFFSSRKIPDRKFVLDLRGTPFQIQVWKALLRIPPGQFVSYQNIGSLIRKSGASRAIGSAIGQNPVAYLIPCHRVIRQTGETGGYCWKNERKKAMMGYE